MSNPINFPPTMRVGILVYEGFEPIDVLGITEAFTISRFLGKGYLSPPPYPFEVLFISNEDRPSRPKDAVPGPVKSMNGPRVAPDMFRDDALRRSIDILMIPGGNTGPLIDNNEKVKALSTWVRAMDEQV